MSKPQHNSYPPWSPRFWNGMRIGALYRLLAENRFRISPTRIPMTGLATGVSCINSVLGSLQSLVYGRRIASATLEQPPVFIVGHWRSGTTLVHELLTLDSRFAFPSNFDAFCPHHLLISKWFMQPLLNLLLPGKRPMDGMSLGASSPQEDDFALISLGAPTLYRKIAFPNHRFELPAGDLETETGPSLEESLRFFFNVLNVHYRKQLVLKSPPHTFRIQQLAKWFPGAKFVHVARNPLQIVPSTMKLWRALDWTQGFHLPRYSDEELLEYVLREFEHMYHDFDAQLTQLKPEQFVDIRFEELINEPLQTLGNIYDQFGFGDFAKSAPTIESYFAENRSVKPSKNTQDERLRETIADRCSDYLRRFGYEVD
ncbi:MAG: sulfotransferase [Pirellulaceae bacterium]